VPRRVGDDEAPARGLEIAVRHIDRDALLALGLEPIDEQREVERPAARPDTLRIGGELLELVLRDRAGLVQQPPDERRLAVVDGSAGQESQRAQK
jgi:hypothetical protein